MDGPGDRPLNHAVVCGARVAKATRNGHFEGDIGRVIGACVNVVVSEAGTKLRQHLKTKKASFIMLYFPSLGSRRLYHFQPTLNLLPGSTSMHSS